MNKQKTRINNLKMVKYIKNHRGGFDFAGRLQLAGIDLAKVSRELTRYGVDRTIDKYCYLFN